MKKLYKTLQEKLSTRPRFQLKYLMLRCPAFIADALLHKQRTPSPRRWWADYPRVEDVHYDNNAIEYIPKYE